MKSLIKYIATAILVAGFSIGAYAQAYTQGSKQLNVGLGLGSTFYGSGYTSVVPPIGISFEYGMKEQISVGGYLGYASSAYEYNYFGNWKYTYNYVIIGARGSYHFATSDNLDPYAGIMLGYNVVSSKFTHPAEYSGPSNYTASSGGGIFGAHLGARYFFSPKLGAFGELGYGIAYLTVGLTSKF